MPYLPINDARIYYEDEGQGTQTVVFAHSMLFNLRMFDDQVNYLKPDYRCVRFDFRGQGQSDVTSTGYDLETLTEDTAGLIRSLECSPCHFVGFSMGGMVGMRLALRHPELVRSLILIDTSSEPNPAVNRRRDRLLLMTARHLGLRSIAERVIAMFFGRNFLKDPERKPDKNIWKRHFLANTRSGIIKAVKGVLDRQGITEELHRISIPVLILVGEEDRLTPYTEAELMHEKFQNSTLKVIPRAGHMSTVEEPEKVNAMIGEFLEKLKTVG